MEEIRLPIGVRRDGSYYTRVEWASTSENDPTFWVNNLIDDDLDRNGGTWGANTETTADAILSFFGEKQLLSEIHFYKNVGITISVIEELAKKVNIYICDNDSPTSIKRKDNDINIASWQLIKTVDIVMEEGWQKVKLEQPVMAKYVRIELVDNFCNEPKIPWVEMNEIKLF